LRRPSRTRHRTPSPLFLPSSASQKVRFSYTPPSPIITNILILSKRTTRGHPFLHSAPPVRRCENLADGIISLQAWTMFERF
jgi:hypothetical protein